MSSGMSMLLKLLVTKADSCQVNVFECVRLFLPLASSVAASMSPPPWTKTIWVVILFEWIEIRYFKLTWVDFISGQLKFKCTNI